MLLLLLLLLSPPSSSFLAPAPPVPVTWVDSQGKSAAGRFSIADIPWVLVTAKQQVWDLRVNRCIQTITTDDWDPIDNKPSVLAYDHFHSCLVTAMNKPHVWHNKCISQLQYGHTLPVCKVLFNDTFDLVVSGDEEAVVCVWRCSDGDRVVRFSECHPASKITAMCFDSSERRLITGANDGSVRMWNFNNGSLLKEFFHKDDPEEVRREAPLFRV